MKVGFLISQRFHKERVAMRRYKIKTSLLALLLLAALPVLAGENPGLKPQPAVITSAAPKAMMLGCARAGKRLVAVGDHGIVLLSDDDGTRVRQAKAVAVGSTLTSVSFADEKYGWAVGQWGVIVATVDGGETWQLQRSD